MSPLDWLAAVVAAPFAIYYIARCIFAAYFVTREQFTRRDRNGRT